MNLLNKEERATGRENGDGVKAGGDWEKMDDGQLKELELGMKMGKTKEEEEWDGDEWDCWVVWMSKEWKWKNDL